MSEAITNYKDKLVSELAQKLLERKLQLVTAESCTGGLIAASCTELAGSSAWFDRGFVTYSNQAKVDMLNVPMDLIERQGAVSESVAKAMAKGAFLAAGGGSRLAISVTGIAGPSGGSIDKPIGTVWMSLYSEQSNQTWLLNLSGERQDIRLQVVEFAINSILTS